jgi:hypothetical protein
MKPEKQRAYAREHYRRNKPKYLERNKRNRARLRQMVIRAKDVPCADCGKRYPSAVMDFDHISLKAGLISEIINWQSPRRLADELAKCEVVCANCQNVMYSAPTVIVCGLLAKLPGRSIGRSSRSGRES